jgi:hypothetical protein
MKLTTMTVAIAATAFFGHAAEAKQHQHFRISHHEGSNDDYTVRRMARQDVGRHTVTARRFARHDAGAARYAGLRPAAADAYALAPSADQSGYGPRPAAWCGWEMRHLVSRDPGPSYNLAANWAHWGHGGPAGVGAVVVWSHHVGKIVGRDNGMWVIESGNDGHQMRSRARSIAGAIAIRWG